MNGLGLGYGLCMSLLRVVEESAYHLFVECLETRKLWFRLGVMIGQVLNLDITAWFFECIKLLQGELLNRFVMACWGLWCGRNENYWNATPVDNNLMLQRVLSFLSNWRAANEAPLLQNVRDRDDRWKKPLRGRLKMNTNAALDHNHNVMGLGWVLRDDDGSFLAAKNMQIEGLYAVREAEAMCMREALSWLKDTGMGGVDIETDSQLLFNALSCVSFHFAFGLLVDDVKELASLINDVQFGFVRRSANCAPHALAREAISVSGCGEWFDTPPQFLGDILARELMN